MQVQQVIRNSADIVTITNLAPGDVYKRIEESSYGDPVLRFGIVQSVMNNGEDAAVTALEYAPDYTLGATTAVKVFTGTKPVAIFPATPDEVLDHIDGLEKAAEEALDRATEAERKAVANLDRVRTLRLSIPSLTAPTTTAAIDA